MDTLQLCDSFEPYYAGRKSFLKSGHKLLKADPASDETGEKERVQPKKRETLVSSRRTSAGSMKP